MADQPPDEGHPPEEVAEYVADLAQQLAIMARSAGLVAAAEALDLAAIIAVRALQENAAPGDAA